MGRRNKRLRCDRARCEARSACFSERNSHIAEPKHADTIARVCPHVRSVAHDARVAATPRDVRATASRGGASNPRPAMSGHDELTLLLIEETAELDRHTATSLAAEGVLVTCVTGIGTGFREALRRVHDAVLLDLVRRLADASALTTELRDHSDVPLIVLTPSGSDMTDEVAALEAGADDVVHKPFSPIDLMARVRAAVRRARRLAGPAAILRDVTSYEFAILRVLAERRGRVLTREQILDYAKGGSENAFERSIDVRISRLRRKLSESSQKPSIIRTVRGIGYLLTPE
jgi:two-component system OmpR family response regulator